MQLVREKEDFKDKHKPVQIRNFTKQRDSILVISLQRLLLTGMLIIDTAGSTYKVKHNALNIELIPLK